MKIKDFITTLKFVGRAIVSTDYPLLAHLVVTRRCNLSCAYCNEYDKVSPPVPLDVMKRRIEALANLKTAMITCTGGEPFLHPDLAEIISEIRHHGILVTLITNGYLLTEERIKKLNEAGLQSLQISIDNIKPDEVSYKSLKVLDRKLKLLADYAEFRVNINSVLGISDERALDAITVSERAIHYGFSNSVGLLHDGNGILTPLSEKQLAAYNKIGKLSKSLIHYWNHALFQKNLIKGQSNKVLSVVFTK